jgi:hypothetical protein
MGCSNVKVALSDSKQLKSRKSKSAYLKIEAGKIYAFRTSLINTADDFIGTPYKYASTDLQEDLIVPALVYCSKNNLELPRSSSTMAAGVHINWQKQIPAT